MRFIKPLILFICVFTVSALAETQNPTTPQQPAPKDVRIVLCKQTDKNVLRAPSLKPQDQIIGTYSDEGMFAVCLPDNSIWEMEVQSIDGETSTYIVSTINLQQGVYIGLMSDFSITLTNESNITYVGEICL